MIIKSDDSFNIPFGYLQLKDECGHPLDGIYVGIIAVLYQFKGIYRTNVKDLAASFKITEDNVIRRLDFLHENDFVRVDNIKGQLLLTHGEKYKHISDAAYSKRASFARKMKGTV
jgi:carbonic anhydrase